MLDGEIVCPDRKEKLQFKNLLFRRAESRLYALDLLSSNGEDLRYFPLADRKHRLRGIAPHEVRESPLIPGPFAVAQPGYFSEASRISSVAVMFWARSSASALLSGSR